MDKWYYKNNPNPIFDIVICPECNGRGAIFEDILIDHHRGIYDTKRHTCERCEGNGRLERRTTTTFEKLK